jgi:hypothetical protein
MRAYHQGMNEETIMSKQRKKKVEKPKERVYTFSHHNFHVGLGVSLEEVEKRLIEERLSKGYFPMEIKTEIVEGHGLTKRGLPYYYWNTVSRPNKYSFSSCMSTYMGKKAAREFWEKNKYMKSPSIIKLIPPTKG